MARHSCLQVHCVNRVVYVFGAAPTAPIEEVTTTHLKPDVIRQLQEADAIVNEVGSSPSRMWRLRSLFITLFLAAVSSARVSIVRLNKQTKTLHLCQCRVVSNTCVHCRLRTRMRAHTHATDLLQP